MDDFALRAIERILDSVVGGISIYLGYRLFLSAPRRRTRAAQSSAEFKLPGETSIILTRVGPGIFFALFGAAVIVTSLSKGMSYHQVSSPGGAGPNQPAKVTDWNALGGTSEGAAPLTLTRDQIDAGRRDLIPRIAALNAVLPSLKPELDTARRADIELALPAIKVALMHRVWDKDWGDEAVVATFQRNGDRVSGRYSFGLGEATINGVVMRDRKLYFDWSWGGTAGRGVLAPDAAGGFSGTWGYRDARAGGGEWSAQRQ